LRNTKNMLTVLKAARPNDRPPLYCINQVGMHKRAEIDVKSFAKTMESQPLAVIPFDSKLFSTAANNGQMIAEVSKSHRTTELFQNMANRLAGRGEVKKPKRSLLGPLLKKLKGRTGRASAPHRKAS
jgi:pilus assembly protein CpaE